jgi:hypothetical protein
MPDATDLQRATAARWAEIAKSMRDDSDVLVRDFLTHLHTIGVYQTNAVPAPDLEKTAADSFALLIDQLSEGEISPGLANVASQLGARRARQGVPLEALLTAVRADFTVLWNGLLTKATSDDMPVLVAHVDKLLGAVDDYARTVQNGYLSECAVLAKESSNEQRRFIDQLFDARAHRQGLVREVGLALGIDASSAFTVIAATTENSPALRDRAAEHTARGRTVFSREMSAGLALFAPVATWQVGTHWLDGVACAVVPQVRGLAAVPEQVEALFSAAAVMPPSIKGPRSLREAWPLYARSQLEKNVWFGDGPIVEALATCPAHERERLVELATTYVTTGSIARTAETLFCHRNTIVNRLKRFREVTGYDLTVPLDSAAVVVSLSNS